MPYSIKKLGMMIVVALLFDIAGYATQIAPLVAQSDIIPRCKGNPSSGPVTCYYFYGGKYVGGWANGRPNGRGIFVFLNGGSSEGESSGGGSSGGESSGEEKSGGGSSKYDRYEGEWRNGIPHGSGVYIAGDDTRFEGIFREGIMKTGKVFYSNGDRFEGTVGLVLIFTGQGELVGGTFQPIGQGKFFFANGSRFEGEYFGGSIFGRGVFTHADGTRCEAQFYNEELDGKGSCRYPNKDRYEGELRRAVPHGRGVMIKANGQRYQGMFRNGQPFDPKKP